VGAAGLALAGHGIAVEKLAVGNRLLSGDGNTGCGP
jgi:hypothetical protein